MIFDFETRENSLMGGPGIIDGKEHPETDNFLPCKFIINGITYSSAENYFQCAKTINEQDREKFFSSDDILSDKSHHIKLFDVNITTK